MVTYGGKDEFSGVNPTQSAAAQARLAQIQRENEATQQQRQQAPSNLSSSSQQFKDVKAAESQAAQQDYVSGQFQQKGTTQDQYTAARDQALKSGSFNYGGTNAFYSPPPVYLNKGGQTIARTSQDITAPINFGSSVSSKESAPSQMANILSKSNTPPQASSKNIQISQVELTKVNALRASENLPPLESIMQVQIVKATTTKPIDQRQATTQALIKAQGSLEKPQENEAVSFLKFPFAGQKVSSPNIPSTSLVDALIFVPIGSAEKGAISLGKGISEFFTKAFSKEAPEIVKPIAKGSSDIGLNVKPTEDYLKYKSFETQASRLPPPGSISASTLAKVNALRASQGMPLLNSKFEEVSIDLGRGAVQSPAKEGGSTLGDIFKPSTSKPEPFKPTEKETPSKGGSLIQLTKEVSKTETKTASKPQFELNQAQKQEEYLRKQEEKALQSPKQEAKPLEQKQEQVTKQEQITKQEQLLRQKQEQDFVRNTPLKYITTSKQIQKQEEKPFPLITIPKPQPKQTPKPQIPLLIPIQITGQTPKQKQGGGYPQRNPTPTIPLLNIPLIPSKTPPPTPPRTPPTPPPGETTPPDKKKLLGGGILGTGGNPGLIGKVSKGGSRRDFIGNVPTSSIVGVYKRGEIIYGEKTIRSQEANELTKASTGKFAPRKGNKLL